MCSLHSWLLDAWVCNTVEGAIPIICIILPLHTRIITIQHLIMHSDRDFCTPLSLEHRVPSWPMNHPGVSQSGNAF